MDLQTNRFFVVCNSLEEQARGASLTEVPCVKCSRCLLYLFSKAYICLCSQGVVRQGITKAMNSDSGDIVPPNLRGAKLVDSSLRGEDAACTADGDSCGRNYNPWGSSKCCSGWCGYSGSCHKCLGEGAYCGTVLTVNIRANCCPGMFCQRPIDNSGPYGICQKG